MCVCVVLIFGVAVVGLDLRCGWLLWVQICGLGLDLWFGFGFDLGIRSVFVIFDLGICGF